MIRVAFSCDVQEDSGIGSIQLLIVDHDFSHIGMGVQIEEESRGGIFGDGSIHLAGGAWRTRVIKLKDTTKIGIDAEAQSFIVVSDLYIIKAKASFVHEERKHNRIDGCFNQPFFFIRWLET
jgi:hypothetical protein